MTGVIALAASISLGGYLETVTSGTYSSGGKVPTTYTGYADATATGTAFGSVTPSTAAGFTVKGIYHSSLSLTVVLMVGGDATGVFSQIQIAGTNYTLSAGTYNGASNYTTFNTPTISPTPFTGTVLVYLR